MIILDLTIGHFNVIVANWGCKASTHVRKVKQGVAVNVRQVECLITRDRLSRAGIRLDVGRFELDLGALIRKWSWRFA